MILTRHSVESVAAGEIAQPTLTAVDMGDSALDGSWLEANLPESYEDEHRLIDRMASGQFVGLYLRGAETLANLEKCAVLLGVSEALANLPEGHFPVIAAIETAPGILAADDLARGQTRLKALVFGRPTLAARMQVDPDTAVMVQAQSTFLLTANAAGAPALMDVSEAAKDELPALCAAARKQGFAGFVVGGLTPDEAVDLGR